jgi:DNA-binding LacI/PurR family transcriptional regulator
MTTSPVPPARARSQVTARSVADAAGVSASTVSRVLNEGSGSELIGEEARRRVRDAATQLGYRPSPIAKALRGGHSNLIGLILREIADPFFAQLSQELIACARDEGYQIVFGYAHGDPNEALNVSSVLDTRHIDGAVVMGDLTGNERVLTALLSTIPAAVGLCRGASTQNLLTVNSDNFAGIEAVFAHLFDLGHRRIGYLEGGSIADIRERRRAFVQCAERRRMSIPNEYIQNANDDGLRGGYQSMRQLVDLPDRPTAVIASDDLVAIGAIKMALERGLSVPDDISITGFDDIELAQYTFPSLTTARQSTRLLAERTLSSLLTLIREKRLGEAESILRIPVSLVLRNSTAAPARERRRRRWS